MQKMTRAIQSVWVKICFADPKWWPTYRALINPLRGFRHPSLLSPRPSCGRAWWLLPSRPTQRSTPEASFFFFTNRLVFFTTSYIPLVFLFIYPPFSEIYPVFTFCNPLIYFYYFFAPIYFSAWFPRVTVFHQKLSYLDSRSPFLCPYSHLGFKQYLSIFLGLLFMRSNLISRVSIFRNGLHCSHRRLGSPTLNWPHQAVA